MFDLQPLLSVLAPGHLGEPVQVVARHVELAAGLLQPLELVELLVDDLQGGWWDMGAHRLNALTEPATAAEMRHEIATFSEIQASKTSQGNTLHMHHIQPPVPIACGL